MTTEQRQRFLYYFYEAERMWQNEQFAEAYPLFEFCYALYPEDAMTNLYLGHIYRGVNLTDQALLYYKQAWKQAPADCWLEYAVTLYNTQTAENRKEAIHVMEQTAKLIPSESDLWDHLRDAYIGAKQYKQAINAQDHLDRIEGYNAYSAINRYRIYMLMQSPKKAISAIEDYLKEDPANLQFQIYRVQLYEATGRPVRQLFPLYQEILKLDPHNAYALNNYAYLLATGKGDLRLAESMSTKAVQAEPNNPTYLDTYAWILYLTGQYELAKIYIRQAVQYLEGHAIPKEIQNHYNQIINH
ncbi:MAG: tetratricopeptide repeat protein [Paludibacteraceae bacterium]|nr:tetratricopeptide repeat protein [Paludibacteraceae bacterium]